ncbi:MAG: hypothetical protein INR65_19045, partial [Gluconacetobacter diazotrophicus]|nr:hypothetical protein [Gluconacetobacter diazotrophicus]
MASVQDQFDAIFGAPRPGRAPDAPGHADPSAAADPAAAAATNDAALQLAATALFRHAHHPAVPAPAAASGFAADAVVPTAIGSTPVVDAAGPAPAIVPTVPAVGAHPAATASGSAAVPATTVLAAAVPAAAPAPAPIVSVPTFFAGNLVLSVYGNGDGSGTYTDNQASPITLEQVTAAGAIVNDYVLPQSDSTDPVTGATEHAVSGEYGSSSEGSLSLSADGRSLVIMGYGVDAATYNAGGAAVYGNTALAQSTSIPGGPYTAVSRVVADIGADGTVDTSTAVFGVFNTNNGRSAATTDGSSFYISGQGVKGDTTQGLFRVADGASAATAIDTSTDTRTAVLFDGTLYVSRDTKQGPTANISSYGGEPTAATAPTVLAGLSNKITLTAAEANTVNAGSVGKSVFLSPENFFF